MRRGGARTSEQFQLLNMPLTWTLVPLAPLLFGLFAIPLGLASRRSARTLGLIACTTVVFSYYALLTLGHMLAFERWVDPVVASWSPNAVVGLAALALGSWVSRRAGE